MKNNSLFGVELLNLKKKHDSRGFFSEAFRTNWQRNFLPIQWNVVFSKSNTLRGMRVHLNHTDYVILISGRGVYGLKDLRKNSPSEGKVSMVEIDSKKLQVLIIPPGIAHGFYFYENSIYVYGVDYYYNPKDEIKFSYLDSDLGIKWPAAKPILSSRDKRLPKMAKIMPLIPVWKAA
ncbi:MAG TPA: dTDP-4-dehydrorhamnose 3,5-epimerase family protein [Patescibacteria group bacterium]